MDYKDREELKKRIEIDLVLLIKYSWNIDIINKLEDILTKLQELNLEGYDD